MKPNKQEIESVLKLSARERYWYCIKKVADSGCIWGLYQDGWALAGSENGKVFLPLWPMPEFAVLCAEGQWIDYKARSLDIYEFLDSYISELEDNDILPAIFYTVEDYGVPVSYDELRRDLNQELGRLS